MAGPPVEACRTRSGLLPGYCSCYHSLPCAFAPVTGLDGLTVITQHRHAVSVRRPVSCHVFASAYFCMCIARMMTAEVDARKAAEDASAWASKVAEVLKELQLEAAEEFAQERTAMKDGLPRIRSSKDLTQDSGSESATPKKPRRSTRARTTSVGASSKDRALRP